MDPRFGLVILLLLNTVFGQSTSNHSGNEDSSTKRNNTVRLSAGIQHNPFLQQFTLYNVEKNPFLQHGNQSQFNIVPNALLPKENQSSSVATFNGGNPFFNIQLHFNTSNGQIPNSAQFFTLTPNTPAPITPPPNTPTSNLPAYPDTSTSDTSYGIFPDRIQRPSNEPSLDLFGFRSPKPISELKCEEYVNEIIRTTDVTSPRETSPGVFKVANVCQNANLLVVGGTEVRPGEFPHMVALGKRDFAGTFILICGGTLISHTWVLSAAHCTYGPNGSPSDARIGLHSLEDSQSGISIVIKNMIRHPDYRPPAKYADVALIELTNPVVFSASIRPACLYQKYDTLPPNGWITGWGADEFAGDPIDKLQKGQVTFIDNLACTILHNVSSEVPHGVTPSMICAGDPLGGWRIDTCHGDSGGPVQLIHPKNLCLFQVIGITSFGQGCAFKDTPGVYTRVSHYLSWIEDIVWPQIQQ